MHESRVLGRNRRAWTVSLAVLSLIGCTTVLGIDKDYVVADGDGGPDGALADASCFASVPSASSETVRDACGVFVAADGSDGSPGTKAKPLKSINAAVQMAGARGKRVYVCNGTYLETVNPTLPVEIYGGFACAAGWTRAEGGATPEVIAPEGEPAFVARGVGGAVVVEDVTFRAGGPSATQSSSIAAVALDVVALRFTRVHLVASDGRDGATSPADASAPMPPPNAGAASGGVHTCTCDGGATSTGAGACTSTPGAPMHDPPSPPGHVGASVINGNNCVVANAGSDAPPGNDGDGGALGSIAETYVPANGLPGADGLPGQGGGGACGFGGGGASGGCGGCGGGGGAPGTGGGASIGLLVRNTKVDIVDSKIETSKAGAGGDGKPGAAGAGGAGGGAIACLFSATIAGAGGKGGNGGAGGGGAGGVSACVVSSGPTPNLDTPTRDGCKHGREGDGGASPSRPGSHGVSDVLVELR